MARMRGVGRILRSRGQVPRQRLLETEQRLINIAKKRKKRRDADPKVPVPVPVPVLLKWPAGSLMGCKPRGEEWGLTWRLTGNTEYLVPMQVLTLCIMVPASDFHGDRRT